MTSYETVRQAALRLGVTERTIQLWAKGGQMPGARKVGRDWMIPVDVPDEEEEAPEEAEPAPMAEIAEPEPEPLPPPAPQRAERRDRWKKRRRKKSCPMDPLRRCRSRFPRPMPCAA